MGIFSNAKNAALEAAASALLRSKIEPYGELQRLSVDSDARTFSGEILLRGDTAPISISEGHYRVEDRDGRPCVVVYGVKVSREWIQNAIDDHMPELAVKVPEFVRSML